MKSTKTTKKRLTITDDGTPLLSYRPATLPALIQVGETAIIDIGALVSGSTSVYCSQIVLYVPVGTDAASLYLTTPAPTGSVNRIDWTAPSMIIKPGSEIGLDSNENYATFTFDNRNQTSTQINYSLVLGVTGTANQLTGDFIIHISEVSGTDPRDLTPRSGQLTLTKYTPQFYLQNLVATVSPTSLDPVTEFQNGVDITMSWESNGTYFELYKKNVATPVYKGPATTCTVPGVATDTTFFLVAMMTIDPGTAAPPAGFEPIYLYDSLTITITNPDLTPNSVNVANNTNVGGTLSVTGNTTMSSAALSGTLSANGNTTVGTPSANANLQVNGNEAVSGNTAVTGNLAVSGTTTLAATTTGAMTTGAITVAGSNSNGVSISATGWISSPLVGGGIGSFRSDGTRTALWVGSKAPAQTASWFNTDDGNAIQAYNNSANNPTLSIVNYGSSSTIQASNNSANNPTLYLYNFGGGPTGPSQAAEQAAARFGISTNARIASESGSSIFTHLPTSKGHRVVTSPLSLEMEIQFSGEAKLSKGRSKVRFNKAITEIISHSQSYRVLLTPTGKCHGLCVTEKGPTGFTVEECGERPNNVTFDWFVIARKPKSLEVNDADEMPGKLPKPPRRQKKTPPGKPDL